jgi:hypothetical protein
MSGISGVQALYAIKLKNTINRLPQYKRQEYLIECIRRHGKIKEEQDITPDKYVTDVCEICKSNDIYYSSHQKECKNCGAVFASNKKTAYRSTDTSNTREIGSFIPFGQLTMEIKMPNGFIITQDLSKLQMWYQSDPSQIKAYLSSRKINEILDSLQESYKKHLSYEKARINTISMWHNILLKKPDIKGNEQKAMQALCIYYSFVYYNLSINLQKLSKMLDVQIGEIYKSNNELMKIFKDTEYEKLIVLTSEENCDIELPEIIESKIELIKKHMVTDQINKGKGSLLNNPLRSKEKAAAIYYIVQNYSNKTKPQLETQMKIYKKRFILSYLSDKCSIGSPKVISDESKRISIFYEKNTGLKMRLFS